MVARVETTLSKRRPTMYILADKLLNQLIVPHVLKFSQDGTFVDH